MLCLGFGVGGLRFCFGLVVVVCVWIGVVCSCCVDCSLCLYVLSIITRLWYVWLVLIWVWDWYV